MKVSAMNGAKAAALFIDSATMVFAIRISGL
jgi:hypothetical protein